MHICEDLEVTDKSECVPARGTCHTNIVSAITHPDLVRLLGWQGVVKLRQVSATLREALDNGEDGFKLLSRSIADDVGLYFTDEFATTVGWRNLFWEHLYPARNKWADQKCSVLDHKISVAVRMRHDDQSRLEDIILPLHQRLRMLKKGQKITEKEAQGEAGVTYEEVQSLIREQGEIDPELLALVLEAKQLQYAGSAANRVDAPLKHKGKDSDDGGQTITGSSDTADEEDGRHAPADAHALGAAPEGGAGAGGPGPGRNIGGGAAAADDAGGRSRCGARVLAVESGAGAVRMLVPGVGVRTFRFSPVFDAAAPQRAVFARFAEAACVAAANGFNACILAYGQTGSGKTHTVFGPPGALDAAAGDEAHGLAVRCGGALLRAAEALRATRAATAATLTATYVQIYEEAVTDLLTGGAVQLRGGAPSGAAEAEVRTEGDLLDVLRRGDARKRRAQTLMNERSSRSHTVLALQLLQRSPGGLAVRSQLLVVDLAGCEQLKKSGAAGRARREAVGINSSLLALRRVIAALNTHASHVPYLESRLTALLRGALGGSCRTHVLVAASGAARDGDETLAALRFGEEAAMVSNRLVGGAAGSVAAALAAVDAALAECGAALARMRAQGRGALPACVRLQDRCRELARKRAALADTPSLAPLPL